MQRKLAQKIPEFENEWLMNLSHSFFNSRYFLCRAGLTLRLMRSGLRTLPNRSKFGTLQNILVLDLNKSILLEPRGPMLIQNHLLSYGFTHYYYYLRISREVDYQFI